MSRRFALVSLLAALAACDSGEPGRLATADFEGPEGEAVVRHLISRLPPLDPGVPKSFCVVKGARLMSAGTGFVERMSDLKLRFVSGEVLTVRDPDRMIVDPSSNLPPVQLQIMALRRIGDERCEAVAAWAYKRTFERIRLNLERGVKGWKVVASERIEGNYEGER